MTDGIINIYKESGYTSHDVVAKLRGILRQKRIGHTGTLDPEAQGVLPVCLGKATKVCDMLSDRDKTYRAVLLLGVTTDTQDTGGQILEQRPVACTEDEVRDCIRGFCGRQQQIPPMYSALKVEGRRLYELARQGIEVERRAREVYIRGIQIEEIRLPEITMTVECSKGTYIRTLCHDIGAALGCGGCMKSLLRTKAGPFRIEDSVKLSQVGQYRDEGRLEELIKPTDSVFCAYPALTLTPEAERLVRNGNPLLPEMLAGCRVTEGTQGRTPLLDVLRKAGAEGRPAGECTSGLAEEPDRMWIRVYGADGGFLAVYGWDGQKRRLSAEKMFL